MERRDMERRAIRTGSNAMQAVAASSSMAIGSRGGRLPLINCPRCRVRVNMIRSKQQETYGELFFVCPNNIKEDPRTCKFLRSQEQYESYLRGLEAEQGLDARAEGQHFGEGNAEIRMQCIELKQEVDKMKHQLHVVTTDICNLKLQRSELKAFGMDTSVAVALCVGVLLGILVTAVWKTM